MQPDKIETTVLFDGSCPLCTAEINQYKLITPAGPIKWVDVSAPEFTAPTGLSQEELMRRFHVIKPYGDLISGAAAFLNVWEQLPSWRWLATVAKIPGALIVMEFAYTSFLKTRPKIQTLFKKSCLNFQPLPVFLVFK
jgi:predicted DCC family thiol-disulfide oxidoreductase YuxK